MNTILNLTQHAATPDQIAQGVCDLAPAQRAQLQRALTFESLPSVGEMQLAADTIVRLAVESTVDWNEPVTAMIGGAGFFMPYLTRALKRARTLKGGRFTPVYAFSQRVVTESVLPDGSVSKTAIFRHVGFVDAT